MNQSNILFPLMQPFMFSKENMMRGYKINNTKVEEPVQVPAPQEQVSAVQVPAAVPVSATLALGHAAQMHAHVSATHVSATHVSATHVSATHVKSKPFTPFQKDKLFWCFFILLKGYEEYEINHSNAFSLEKKIKIETVEKLKSIKDKLKELKLKRTELEDNLVNQPTISIKGLYALCLVHNISITYIYGHKYCEINPNDDTCIKGIIIQNSKKEDSLRWNDETDDEFLNNIKENYWFIENVQKPLNAPSAYALKELQDIAQKLQIDLDIQVNEKKKLKTKTKLYEEILAHI